MLHEFHGPSVWKIFWRIVFFFLWITTMIVAMAMISRYMEYHDPDFFFTWYGKVAGVLLSSLLLNFLFIAPTSIGYYILRMWLQNCLIISLDPEKKCFVFLHNPASDGYSKTIQYNRLTNIYYSRDTPLWKNLLMFWRWGRILCRMNNVLTIRYLSKNWNPKSLRLYEVRGFELNDVTNEKLVVD